MVGLLRKDLYLITRGEGGRVVLLFAVVLVGLSAAGLYATSVSSCGMLVLFALILVYNTMECDVSARWETFSVCTPAGRTGVVAEKYVLMLACLGAGTLLALGRDTGGPVAALRGAAFGGGMGLLIAAVGLPLRFKLGAWSGSLWQLLWGVFVFALLLFGGGALALRLDVELDVVWAWAPLPGGLLLAALYPLSQRFYARREL